MKRQVVHSFIDVVDNALGLECSGADVMRLSKKRLEDVSDLLLDFYEAWAPPAPLAAEIRVFVETEEVHYVDWHPHKPIPRPPIQHLLYVDALVLEDPVATSAAILRSREPGYAHWTLVRRVLASALDSFRPCQQFLLDGSLVLVPGPHLKAAYDQHAGPFYSVLDRHRSQFEAVWRDYAALARREIRQIALSRFPGLLKKGFKDGSYDFAWEEWGLSEVVVVGDGNRRYFEYEWKQTDHLIRSLSASIYSSAQFLPKSLYSEATYRAVLTTLGEHDPASSQPLLKINPALVSGELPIFSGVPVETLVDIRRNEAAFAAWRTELRNAVRLIRYSPSEPGFHETAQATLRDALAPIILELHETASLVSRVSGGTKPAAISFALGLIAAGIQGHSGLDTALTAAGATSAAGLLLRALFPEGPSGARSVLLRLLPYATRHD